MYRRGEGVVQSVEESRRLYQQAAKAGDADAQFSLGELYERGEWVNSDPVAACHWYRLAAEQEHREAQFRLGRLYEKGLGVHQDFVLGYLWYNLSASGGLESARTARDSLSHRMTPPQIAEGQSMSRGWHPKPVNEPSHK
jgi:TPR repeat protein